MFILPFKKTCKKSNLVSRNWLGENVFITHQPAQPNVYHNIYFQFLKKKKRQKETKEESISGKSNGIP